MRYPNKKAPISQESLFIPLQKPPPILETSYIGGRKYMGVAASQNGPIDLSSLLEPKASPDQKRRKIDILDYYFETIKPSLSAQK